jgi:hypothetical protein
MKTLTTILAIICFTIASNKSFSQNSYINTNSVINASGSINMNIMKIAEGVVKVKMNNQPAGVYAVQLVDANGKVIATQYFTNENSSSTETVNFGQTLAGGIYAIIVTNPDTTTTSQKFMLLI